MRALSGVPWCRLLEHFVMWNQDVPNSEKILINIKGRLCRFQQSRSKFKSSNRIRLLLHSLKNIKNLFHLCFLLWYHKISLVFYFNVKEIRWFNMTPRDTSVPLFQFSNTAFKKLILVFSCSIVDESKECLIDILKVLKFCYLKVLCGPLYFFIIFIIFMHIRFLNICLFFSCTFI